MHSSSGRNLGSVPITCGNRYGLLPTRLGWYTKAQQLVYRPDMVGQLRCHGRGHRLPLFGRPLPALSWERARQTLPQAMMRDNEVVVGKRQGELMFQIARVFREGI